jgi:hypothetical protein
VAAWCAAARMLLGALMAVARLSRVVVMFAVAAVAVS